MSQFLLDTNICVHLLKNEYGIKEKIAEVGVKLCFLSEITLAELLYGIENSAPTKRENNIERFDNLCALFSERTLSISNVLYEYARQKASVRRIGRPVGEFDLLIGATAIVHGLTLVTRNTKDFLHLEGI
ncbi:MAG TPA: VapC toxin family PIN domain ribonuclease [Runella sp.]|nr:VapC toxin family PIN domain ribonuclease [Runella sp.]